MTAENLREKARSLRLDVLDMTTRAASGHLSSSFLGERLDDFGGFSFRGIMDRAEEARRINALPVGLAPGATFVRSVRPGEVLTWDVPQIDEDSILVKLRRQPDAL